MVVPQEPGLREGALSEQEGACGGAASAERLPFADCGGFFSELLLRVISGVHDRWVGGDRGEVRSK